MRLNVSVVNCVYMATTVPSENVAWHFLDTVKISDNLCTIFTHFSVLEMFPCTVNLCRLVSKKMCIIRFASSVFLCYLCGVLWPLV